MITVRKFRPDEWQAYKEIRLLALRTEPHFFSRKYEDEAAVPDQEWEDDLASADLGVFGVFDGDKVIGMTGVIMKDKLDPSMQTAALWGSWIDPVYRGRGISHEMYRARIAWAREHKTARRVIVSHRASNEPSKRANQKHGFVYTHTEKDTVWPDGLMEDQVFYELIVK